MSLLKRLAAAALIFAVAVGFIWLADDPRPAPAAVFADEVEQGSPQRATAAPKGGGVEQLREPRLTQRPATRPASPDLQGPAVHPRPPASLDGVPLTPGRWVMPFAARAYRVGCAWACYVSDSGLPHTGQDFPAAEGTPVRSVGAGVVVRSESIYLLDGEKQYCQTLPICGRDWVSYGNFVQIQDATDPTLTVWYAHLATRRVAAGQRVSAGQLIGTSGDVGNSEGPHLHFETRRDDRPVDPMPLLQVRRAVPQPGPVPNPVP